MSARKPPLLRGFVNSPTVGTLDITGVFTGVAAVTMRGLDLEIAYEGRAPRIAPPFVGTFDGDPIRVTKVKPNTLNRFAVLLLAERIQL